MTDLKGLERRRFRLEEIAFEAGQVVEGIDLGESGRAWRGLGRGPPRAIGVATTSRALRLAHWRQGPASRTSNARPTSFSRKAISANWL